MGKAVIANEKWDLPLQRGNVILTIKLHIMLPHVSQEPSQNH